MSRRSRSRLVNGVLAAVIVVFFLVHGTLGSIKPFAGLGDAPTILMWCAVGIAVAHVVMSVVTSYQQLSDTVDPPSQKKRRHLALKWVTGAILVVAVVIHCTGLVVADPHTAPLSAIVVVILAIALGAHLCVGAKSLLKDIQMDRRLRTPFRVVVCAFAALFIVLAALEATGVLGP